MNATHLPLVRAPPDALRHGFHSASQDVRPVHEVQILQKHLQTSKWEQKMITTEQIYGKAAAMRLRTEKSIMEQFGRLPGLPSSRIGLDTITGEDQDIEFSDFLNDPTENPEQQPFRVHEAMEVKLAIF